MKIVKERATSKGMVYEVAFYSENEEIGVDRYFEEAFLR